MRRETKILLATLVLAALWTLGPRVPPALASMESFRIDEVRIHGLRALDRETALELMGVREDDSVFGDTEAWAAGLRRHPMVREVTVERRLPRSLVVRVTERTPVALAPTPTLEPVDAEGVRLPLDPAEQRLDLPVLEASKLPAPGSRLLPSKSRRLAAEVARLVQADTAFHQMVSSVGWVDESTLVARWSEPPVDFLFRPEASPHRLRQGFAVLADALAREPHEPPVIIDLRYADQVVVRRNR